MFSTRQMDRLELRPELEKLHRESYGWALRCCARGPVEAEEVLQAAYLKVLEGRALFRGQATFKTWLFAVIRLTAAGEGRRHWLRRLRLMDYEKHANKPAADERPDETLARAEVQTLFRQALAVLPRRQEQALQLVFYHDLSLSEAAAVMGVSVGSARTHYERGKKALREWLLESKVFDETGLGRKAFAGAVP